MITGFRRTVTAAVAALALAAGGAAWATTSASATATSTASAAIGRCTASDLAVWVFADSADSVSGTTFFHLEYTNIGRTTCSLDGYPGVSAATLARVRLGQPAAHNSGVPATTVDLAPGATAHSVLGYVSKAVGPGCKPREAGLLQVVAPNAAQAKRAYFPLVVCTTGTVDLNVRRVQAGL